MDFNAILDKVNEFFNFVTEVVNGFIAMVSGFFTPAA